MKIDHSSLSASCYLSREVLNKLPLSPERDIDKLTPYLGYIGPLLKSALGVHNGTLPPYENTNWFDDEDIRLVVGMHRLYFLRSLYED